MFCAFILIFKKHTAQKLLRECFEQFDALLSSENPDDEAESNVKGEFLALIRQPVWDYLALNCPSFANHSEAVFSEIFSCSIFDKLRMEEKYIFRHVICQKAIVISVVHASSEYHP